MTFDNVIKEIELAKDEFLISNLLEKLTGLFPEDQYMNYIVGLTNKKFQIKAAAIRLLHNFNCPNELEEIIIRKIQNEPNKNFVCSYISALNLNSTEKSTDFLLKFYSITSSIDVKSSIIRGLQNQWIRNQITDVQLPKVCKLIGNNYPFFQGYWCGLKKAQTASKENWKIIALEQLRNNNLNLLFHYNNDIDFHLQIDKMSSHFIRFINLTAIYKNYKSNFSKFYTPKEFYLSDNRLFDSIFEKSKSMRLDINREKILKLVDAEMLPKLQSRIELWDSLKIMPFKEFEEKQNRILDTLYGSNWDWVVAYHMTQSVDMFKENEDFIKYINFIIEKWKMSGKGHFKIYHHLEDLKNKKGY